MRILVTGGAGYIGSHVSKALAAAGHTPIVYDNLEMGHDWAVKWGPLVQADLADGTALRKALQGVDAVIHLAGYIFVGESVKAPSKYYRNNFNNSLELLDAMVDTGVRNIVFSSTAAVYGSPDKVPIPEDARHAPLNPYGESKLFIEQALHWYAQAYGLRWLALRYFNASGADPDAEVGELHNPETHLVPLAIYAAMGARENLHVFGTDYPTVDGTAVRDYIHVSDLASAHVLGIDYLRNGGSPAAMNVGTGEGQSVQQVIAAVERISGLKVPSTFSPRREGDSPMLVAEANRIRKALGWKPTHSRLDQIVATAYAWHQKTRDLIPPA